jgi:hypothetical protein
MIANDNRRLIHPFVNSHIFYRNEVPREAIVGLVTAYSIQGENWSLTVDALKEIVVNAQSIDTSAGSYANTSYFPLSMRILSIVDL